ncbi:MAG: hypothetical protein JNM62_16785 [Flavobacteriales bacterium]|nr:hypothetical protein [Flavobacteriales bacterium]
MSIKIQVPFILALVVLSTSAQAQMGIRYGAQHEKPTTAKFGSDWHMLLGWDFDLNDRLSGGLDFTTDMNWGSGYNMPDAAMAGPDFYEKVKTIGAQYRSQFHFTDNDDGASIYMGPTIGVRAIKHKIDYYEEVSNGWFSTSEFRETEASKVFFPLGMRLGVRGPLEGGYGDIFLAIGANIGSGDAPINDVRILRFEATPNKVFFQIGLCYGVGW